MGSCNCVVRTKGERGTLSVALMMEQVETGRRGKANEVVERDKRREEMIILQDKVEGDDE